MKPVMSVYKVWAVLALNLCLRAVDLALDLLGLPTATRGSRKERTDAERYENSAHVVKVWATANYFYFVRWALSNFVYSHLAYTHPDVIKKENVSPWFVTDSNYVVFGVHEVSEPPPHDTERYPFFVGGSVISSTRLIIVPASSFHRVAQEIGDPKGKLLVFTMSVRCGSTLLSQALHRVSNCRSYSEPTFFSDITRLWQLGRVEEEEAKRLIQSGVRLYCKHLQEKDQVVALKLPPHAACVGPIIKRIFPSTVLVANLRLPGPCIKSFLVTTENFGLGLRLSYWPFVVEARNYQAPNRLRRCERRVLHDASPWIRPSKAAIGAQVYILGVTNYLGERDLYDGVLFYEDLIRDPRATFSSLLGLLDLPDLERDVGMAMKALSSESGSWGRGDWNGTMAGVERNAAGAYADADAVFASLELLPFSCGMSEEEFRTFLDTFQYNLQE